MKPTRLQFAMALVREGTWKLTKMPPEVGLGPRWEDSCRVAQERAAQEKKAVAHPLPGLKPFGSPDWLSMKPLADMTERERDAFMGKHLARWVKGGHEGLSMADVVPVAVEEYESGQKAAA